MRKQMSSEQKKLLERPKKVTKLEIVAKNIELRHVRKQMKTEQSNKSNSSTAAAIFNVLPQAAKKVFEESAKEKNIPPKQPSPSSIPTPTKVDEQKKVKQEEPTSQNSRKRF